MRLLSQKIAQRANHDDKEVGKFWQARYRAVRLLDETAKPIFERLGIDADVWCELTRDFGRLFSTVAGKPRVIEMTRSRCRHQRYKIRSRARELLTT